MLPKIKVITLDRFYACSDIPVARDLFGKMILLRAQGYGPDYPDFFLPVDSADYICRHHLFCIEDQGELWP